MFFEYQKPISSQEISFTLERDAAKPDVVFVPSVHQVYNSEFEDTFYHARPRVLCRPSGEGKSTELNLIKVLFDNIVTDSPKHTVECTFDTSWLRKDRNYLFQYLKAKTKLKGANSFQNILSRLSESPKLILFDNVENLSEDALAYLIGNVHYYAEETARFGAERQIFICISGSLNLSHVGRDLNSIYFTTDTPDIIRDYERAEIQSLASFIPTSDDGEQANEISNLIAEKTSGEKRMTNLLFEQLRRSSGESFASGIASVFNSMVAKYRHNGFREDTRLFQALHKLASHPRCRRAVRKMWSDQEVHWSGFDTESQKILYNNNFVIVQGEAVRFRNQLTADLMGDCVVRERRTNHFVRNFLPRDSLITKKLRIARKRFASQVKEKSFGGQLLWYYYGEVVDIRDDDEAMDLIIYYEEGREFIATVDMFAFGRQMAISDGFIKYGTRTNHQTLEGYFFFDQED